MCKFIETSCHEALEMQNFVFETERRVMEHVQYLSHHRAILVTDGEGELHLNGEIYPLAHGTLVFCFAGEHFFVSSKQNVEYIYVSFSGARADALFRRFAITTKNRLFAEQDGCIPLWRESLLRASEETTDLAAESVLLYTFSHLKVEKVEKDELLQKITELSEENFNDPTLSLAVLADELNYNAKYLSHFFKEKMKTSYTEYLRMLRLKYAVSLLEHGLDSVKNVAILSGFSDPLYFSTVFKKSIGCSPKEYAERHCRKSREK